MEIGNILAPTVQDEAVIIRCLACIPLSILKFNRAPQVVRTRAGFFDSKPRTMIGITSLAATSFRLSSTKAQRLDRAYKADIRV